MLKTVFSIIMISIVSVVVVAIVIYLIIQRKKVKLMMSDERLRNAKLFDSYKSFAISPDGFIGIVNVPKIIIFHIKEIIGFQIAFDNEKIANDTSILLFDNIISKIEPFLGRRIKDIRLMLNKEDNTLLEIPLLISNTTTTGGKSRRKTIILEISESRQNEIKEVLSTFESVERSVKKEFH